MSKHCDQCGQAMTYGPADLEDTVRGIRVRMRHVPAWACPACGNRQVTAPVARYLSDWLRQLLTQLPPCPGDLEQPFVPVEVVFASR